MDFPLPEPTPLSQPYWDALKEGRLTFQRCRKCSHAWLPPRAECPECLAAEWDWTDGLRQGPRDLLGDLSPRLSRGVQGALPYNVALVELDEGPRLITNIVNPEAGMRPSGR
jgi:uncharacterized OB-fold protein